MIRNVQDLRKETGLEVSDTIVLHLVGLDDLAPLFDMIGREVLAVQVSTEPPTGGGAGTVIELDDGESVRDGDDLGPNVVTAPGGRGRGARRRPRHRRSEGGRGGRLGSDRGPRHRAGAAPPVGRRGGRAGPGRLVVGDLLGGAAGASADAGPVELVGVGCTAQWSGTVAVDAAGDALMRAVIWMDSRGNSAIRAVAGGSVNVLGYDPRKLMRWVQVTGGAPGLSGKDPVAHILFIRQAFPDVYARTAAFLEPVDYLNLRLTGRVSASFDSIAAHWVTDNRDVTAVDLRRQAARVDGSRPWSRCPTWWPRGR